MNLEAIEEIQDRIKRADNKLQNSIDRDIAIRVAVSQGFNNPEILMSRSDKTDSKPSLRVHTYVLMDPNPDCWNRMITVKIDYSTWEIHSRVWKANSPHPNRCSVDAYFDASQLE